MRILALADEPSGRLWGEQCKEALAGIDLILSAGDLPSSYLSFLTCFTSAPVIYVHGNHDDKYAQKPPEGCLCADGKIVQLKGVRILGLGGSLRYRPDAVNMYSEQEMEDRIRSLRWNLRSTGGFDILLTHSPIRGVGDQEHISQAYSAFFQRQRDYHGIPVINASTSYVFDLPDTPDRKEPSRRGLRIMEKASRFE